MARLFGTALTAEVALSAATARTVLQLVAPANHRVVVKRWGVFFDGQSVSAEPVLVRLLFQTSAGTMSALTPKKMDGSLTETLQTTAQHSATVEPSAGDVLDTLNVHPQQGYREVYPLGEEIILGGGDRIGIECTAPDGVNVVGTFVFEE